MTTRFNSRSKLTKGVPGVRSGYEGQTTPDIHVPSNGLTDIDRALFEFFDRELALQVTQNGQTIRVPTIVAAGEKWAQVKQNDGVHDNSGGLILPLTTIIRKEIAQSMDRDIAGRGSNQHTGELIIKRVLSKSDRGLQNWLNKSLVRDQRNVPEPQGTAPGQLSTGRELGLTADDPTVRGGGLLKSDIRHNLTEIITIPTPQYVTVKYEVTFWTQYMRQMNQIVEGCVSAYLPQTRGWRLEAANGYYFYAYVTSDSFSSSGNETDSAGSERIIKSSIDIEVPSFILASATPGAPIPVRRFISNPMVSFDVSTATAKEFEGDLIEEPFLGSDDPTLPRGTREDRKDQRKTYPVGGRDLPGDISERDPALLGRKRGQKYGKWKRVTAVDANGVRTEHMLRVKSQNLQSGELILDEVPLAGLTIVSVDE